MSTWRRVSKRQPCPVCSKPDWCTVTADGSAVCCMRVASEKPLRNDGWLHRLTSDDWHRPRVRRIELPAWERSPVRDFGELSAQYEAAAGDSTVAWLAAQLGVSAESLRRLHIGHDGRAYTFPMRMPDGSVCGIRLRYPNGRKLSVKGGRDGLFLPDPATDETEPGPLFIAEGPTDCAALLDLGFVTIGRPSCSGGTAYVVQLARNRNVIIVGDADGPGKRGAIQLARELRPSCPSVQIIIPPPGIKDARAWLQAGATPRDIELTLRDGPIVRFAEPTRRAVGVSYRETG